MRIELLDPRWKTQRDALEARKAQASELQRGADVVASLKGLARARVDLFGAEADEERRRRQEEEDKARQREREKVVWDGHTASKTATQDRFSTSVNFDEQIAAIMRAKGLGPQEAGAMGPGIGTAAAPAPLATLPPPPASLPAPPHAAYTGPATVSSGPQPASAFAPPPAMMQPPMGMPMGGMQGMPPMGGMPPQMGGMPPPMGMGMPGQPVMLPPLHFQGAGAPGGFGYAPAPQAGQVRSADQMDGADAPPAKRQKVAKLPGGQLYPEQHWLDMHPHPVSLQVQLPTDASKPEWKLEGQTITLPDVPLTLFVGTLRDRILQQTGSALGASKIRLSLGGKMLTNANTIASYNLEEDDVLVLSVTTKKK
jgi:splicing factor 3A subunit 1